MLSTVIGPDMISLDVKSNVMQMLDLRQYHPPDIRYYHHIGSRQSMLLGKVRPDVGHFRMMHLAQYHAKCMGNPSITPDTLYIT